MQSKVPQFVWLELKPEQRFKDDHENQILKIIQYAGEFAFFIFRNKSEMRLIIRTTDKDKDLFRTIDGLAVEDIDPPLFKRTVTKYLALKNHFMIPLVDPCKIVKSDIYSKFWQQSSSCMMACFVQDQTKKISRRIDSKVNHLEGKMAKKNSVFSSKMKINLAGAKSKLERHNFYNCSITFSVETMHEFPYIEKNQLSQEKIQFEDHITNLKKELSKEAYKIEYMKQFKIHSENIKKIKNKLKLEKERTREDIAKSIKTLDKIINSILLNSFSHRIKTHKIKFNYEKRTPIQKFVELFATKSINPYSFVPKKLNSKSLALSDTELAFFLSFPQEKDIQRIKLGVGVYPTFVRSPSQDLVATDITKQYNLHQSSD